LTQKAHHIPTLGILGGGQLGRMTALSAYRLGLNVSFLERKAPFPCQEISTKCFIGDWHNKALLKQFADTADMITLENEFINASSLAYLESLGKPVYPSSKTLSLIQDKLIQKENLQQNGLNTAPFSAIESEQDALDFGQQYGYPFLLKSRREGYDGYGNRTIKTKADIKAAFKSLGFAPQALLAEAFIDFQKELAVMVTRSVEGNIRVYPLVETIQENHICKLVIAPAEVEPHTAQLALTMATDAIKAIDGIGIYGVEMFLTKTNELYINELAPRPHNSGHYSIDACVTSQFENLLRAIFGWKLGSTDLLSPSAVMINLLGKRNGPVSFENIDYGLSDEHVKLHIYGKKDNRIGRKMGHITVLNHSRERCLENAMLLESKFEL
jgi:5-(carboxyamino)imidazole ribonucleotide synthase